MAARTGNLAWKVHFQGLDRKTKIRRSSTIVFDQEGNKVNVPLMMGSDATYIDNLSESHPNDSQSASLERKKVVAINVGGQVYYVDVNDLIKPASLDKVDLKPQAFGLSGQFTLTNYISNLKSSIRSRQDIKGDLQDYLLDLVDYINTGTGSLSGYNLTNLPMASIEKEFGEALGPIFCIKRGLSSKSLGKLEGVNPLMVDTVKRIRAEAEAQGCDLILPSDVVTAPALDTDIVSKTVGIEEVQADQMILDFGPKSVAQLAAVFVQSKTIVWNGPLGAFEVPPFDDGTRTAARRVAELTASGEVISIAGGGDTVAALEAANAADAFSYITMAGGAFLEWLEGRTLPGVAVLQDAYRGY